MKAFHGNQAIKDLYVTRVEAHQKADEIVQGCYWEGGKGCAVGCTLHSSHHIAYERELGIPRQLAYLQDRIFEGLANEEAKRFPLAFLQAIPVGADLDLIVARFLLWLLNDPEQGVLRFVRLDQTRQAIVGVATLYQRKLKGETITEVEWRTARAAAAYYAAYAAYYAAAASYAADAAAAAYAAAYAAYAADADAADAAYAAAYAADAYAADAYAADADAAAREKAFSQQRDYLLKLLWEAPILVEV